MSDNLADHYSELGVNRDATPDEIRRAYHRAARRIHPDVSEQPQANELFIALQKAYEVLADPTKRAAYDASLPADRIPGIQFRSTFGRPGVSRLNEPQIVDVLIELQAVTLPEVKKRPTLNICLVIDRSTSMQGERMDTVKSAAIELIRQIEEHDYLSVVTFNDRATVLIPSDRWNKRAEPDTKIQMIQTGGGTEIFRGLEAGVDELRKHWSRGHINHMILLTDGHTYGDDQNCLMLADQAGLAGIGISGMGIGNEWNDNFLDELAKRTGGSSRYIEQLDDIKNYLEEKFRSFGQVFAENTIFDLEMEPGVELRYAFRFAPEITPLPFTFPIHVGSVPREGSLSLLLEFLIPPLARDQGVTSIAHGNISYRVPTHPERAIPLRVNLEVPISETTTLLPPNTMMVQVLSRLTLYRLQERAMRELMDGNVEGATRHLQNLATHLLTHGERELARTVIKETENVIGGHELSEAGKKQIKFKTRALLLPSSSSILANDQASGGTSQ